MKLSRRWLGAGLVVVVAWGVWASRPHSLGPAEMSPAAPLEVLDTTTEQASLFVQKVESLNQELDEVLQHVEAAELEIEETQKLVANQSDVLREIDGIESDYDTGGLTAEAYLDRRARLSARVLSGQQ